MKIIDLNDKNFEDLVSDGKVVVDFWAPWCGPCKKLAGDLEELSEELKEQYTFYKVNVDEQCKIASRFNIRSLPTLLLFQNGKNKGEKIGLVSKQKIKDWLFSY
jgi:thioredoxin 1